MPMSQRAPQVPAALPRDAVTGLGETEARARLKSYGPNVIPRRGRHPVVV